jgi:hypothetical protein
MKLLGTIVTSVKGIFVNNAVPHFGIITKLLVANINEVWLFCLISPSPTPSVL